MAAAREVHSAGPAGSFMRWLGSWCATAGAATSPSAIAGPGEHQGDHREGDRADVRSLPSRAGVLQEARHDQQPHRVEDEERTDEPERDGNDSHFTTRKQKVPVSHSRGASQLPNGFAHKLHCAFVNCPSTPSG
jgi:hypothetical protein